jgi:hypothetical protein
MHVMLRLLVLGSNVHVSDSDTGRLCGYSFLGSRYWAAKPVEHVTAGAQQPAAGINTVSTPHTVQLWMLLSILCR